MAQPHEARLAVLAGHFKVAIDAEDVQQVHAQECAATASVTFGRQAATDAAFARPATRQLPRDERIYETARLYGDGVASEYEGRPRKQAPSQQAVAQKAAAPTGRPAKAQAHGFEWVHGWAPQVTVLTSPDASHIVFQLPGVRPEDLRLRLEGRRLTISGRRVRAIAFRRPAAASRELAVERPGQWPARRLLPGVRSKEPVQQGPSTVVHRGDFSAAWALPAGDLSRLRARFADERLYLTLPA